MQQGDNRHIARDSLFLMAQLRTSGQPGEHRVKVRNLSAGGMMGEGPVSVTVGSLVEVDIRNIGWVTGAIAWVQQNRFGVAFENEIDPKLARVNMQPHERDTRTFVRTYEAQYVAGNGPRKI